VASEGKSERVASGHSAIDTAPPAQFVMSTEGKSERVASGHSAIDTAPPAQFVMSTEGETEFWTKFANAFETVVADGFAPAKQTPSKPKRRIGVLTQIAKANPQGSRSPLKNRHRAHLLP
jgi:hypothetical protein